jgi:hypothetical protein
MDIRQKSRDFVLLLKKDRKAQVIAGCVVLAVLFMMFSEPPRSRRMAVKQVPEGEKVESGKMDNNEAYVDLVTAFNTELRDMKDAQVKFAETTKELKTSIEESEGKTAEIFQRVIERIADIEANQTAGDGGGGQDPIDVVPEQPGELEVEQLEQWGNLEKAEVAPPPKPEPEKLAMIAAGDSVRVKLLAGVNAPTDGTPYPVVFKVLDDVIGPDGSALPIGEARIIAAAQGSLSDQRAIFRLNKMSLRLPDGSRSVVDVNGWIVGEDGIRGMEGILIDPVGKAIAGAALAGGLQGAGRGLGNNNTVNVNGTAGGISNIGQNVTETAAIGMVSGAGNAWSSFIKKRAALLVPHVKVLSGREATAIFVDNVIIQDLYKQLDTEEVAFKGID